MQARRWLGIAAVVVVVLAACSDDNKSTSTAASSAAGTTSGGGQTVAVSVDAKTAATSVAFLSYFPNEVTLHPGDTIDFASNFAGEAHTVTFGTLVDQGIAKADPSAQDEPAELKKIASLFPEGPGDAIQVAGQPCFLTSGDPPASDACTKDQQKQVDFDGTQSYYNSGFLADGDHFKVTLATNIKPGTYNYFCALHRLGMTGKVTVVAPDAKAQTADEVKTAGQTALADAQAKIKPTIEAIKAGTLPPFIPTATPNGVIAGGASQDLQSAVPVLFGPNNISVKTGDSVTWTMIGVHTITFGSNEALRAFLTKAPDGSVHLNPDSAVPAGGAGQPQGPPGGDPNAPPGPPTPIDGGSYDGTGLHNSGLVLSFPPSLFSYSVKFTKPGSYQYVCLIHPDMTGRVNVT
jgi:plastocyanin